MTPGVASGFRSRGLTLLLLWVSLSLPGAASAVIRGSAFTLPLVGGHGRPEPVLAQRAIDRAWGLSEDSSYSEVNVPQWRSEGLAAGFSAVLPGAGQLYAGEGRGLWFALAEVAGWTANRIYLHRAQADRDRSARFAGDPGDTSSAWSFGRFRQSTGQDAARIAEIWTQDPQAFYDLIARDPAYLAGWKGESAATRSEFSSVRDLSRDSYNRAAGAGYALWLNHVLAALDALRAARLHNLELGQNLELKLRSSWQSGRPAVVATFVRRF
jgi:hypothetical protein